MTFWANNDFEPLRQNRWYATFKGANRGSLTGNSTTYLLKEFQKPSYEISVSEHRLLTQTFKYPGLLKWNPVEIKYISSPIQGTTLETSIQQYTKDSGYNDPVDSASLHQQISKQKSRFSEVSIFELGSDGKTKQTWTMYDCFISKANYGTLSYENEGFVEVAITLQYDYAKISS